MVSNQVLQNTIEGIKEISHVELGIMDSEGREVAVTREERLRSLHRCSRMRRARSRISRIHLRTASQRDLTSSLR